MFFSPSSSDHKKSQVATDEFLNERSIKYQNRWNTKDTNTLTASTSKGEVYSKKVSIPLLVKN